jgi:hypothetical protein
MEVTVPKRTRNAASVRLRLANSSERPSFVRTFSIADIRNELPTTAAAIASENWRRVIDFMLETLADPPNLLSILKLSRHWKRRGDQRDKSFSSARVTPLPACG